MRPSRTCTFPMSLPIQPALSTANRRFRASLRAIMPTSKSLTRAHRRAEQGTTADDAADHTGLSLFVQVLAQFTTVEGGSVDFCHHDGARERSGAPAGSSPPGPSPFSARLHCRSSADSGRQSVHASCARGALGRLALHDHLLLDELAVRSIDSHQPVGLTILHDAAVLQ